MNINEYRAPMRHLLSAFSFFLVASVLCRSCKEEVTSARPLPVAADYNRRGGEQERLAQEYFHWGCAHAENKELPKAVDLYLKSLELMLGSCTAVLGIAIMGRNCVLQQGRCIKKDMPYA